MNTTHLISHWSMDGASRDLAGRFRRAGDVRKTLADGPVEDEHELERAPVLLKRADEEHWTALASV